MFLSKAEIEKLEEGIQKKSVYSTIEAARILNVFTSSIINWTESGKLYCYRTPGGHRKIPREELLRFVREHDFHRNIMIRQKRRVLIVEDDQDATNLCVNILGNDRYDIKTVENGFYAGIVKDYEPDLVILDIMLPDIDGENICKFIRSDKKLRRTKIMAVSAITDTKKINSLFKSGIDEFLGKPYEIHQLEEKVEALLQNVA